MLNTFSITWVGLLEIQNRKILMTREKGKTLFQLPGGGQEEGESLQDTLNREVLEEIGIGLINAKPFDEFILPGRHENVLIKFIIYTADIVGTINKGEDIEEIRWVNSAYESELIDIGNAAKLRLIPELLKKGVID